MKKQATFLEGVTVAFFAAISGAILLTVLPPILGTDVVFRLAISGISLAYILYLLLRSNESIGRVTVVAAWCALTASMWLLQLPLLIYMATQLGAIWLIRSLYFYSSPLSALMDLALHGIALVSTAWVYMHTGSFFLSIWCFFLIQSLFTTIPDHNHRSSTLDLNHNTQFDHAYQAAQTAVRKLTAVH